MLRAFIVAMSFCAALPVIGDEAGPGATFREELTRLHNDAGSTGAIAAYATSEGRRHVAAVGVADSETGAPMRPGHRMLSGSTGKSFVAALALSLAQSGHLDLDAPIGRWLKDKPWLDRLPGSDAVTMRMLLRHRSGLDDHIHDPDFLAHVESRLPDNPDMVLPPEKLIGFLLDNPPLFPPGAGYAYSDAGYILAGLVIESVTGRPYYESLEKRFLRPLQLDLTAPADRRALPGLASGYIRSEPVFGLPSKVTQDGTLLYNPASEWTGGGLITNPGDLARWALALYEGNVMPQPYLDTLLDAVPKDASQQQTYGAGVAYGLGVTLRDSTLGPAWGHRGWTPGYLSIFEYYPEHRLAVALQINELGEHDMTAYAERLAEAVVAGLP